MDLSLELCVDPHSQFYTRCPELPLISSAFSTCRKMIGITFNFLLIRYISFPQVA